MGRSLSDRLEHAWNAFRKPNSPPVVNNGMISYGHRPDRRPVGSYSYRQIIAPILAQITVDAEGVEYKHIRLEDEKYKEDVQSELNECLMVSPNLDQHPAHFRRDIISTMLQEGTVAIVPVVPLAEPVALGTIKADPALAQMQLVRRSRLSVSPVTTAEFARILALGRTRLPTTSPVSR